MTEPRALAEAPGRTLPAPRSSIMAAARATAAEETRVLSVAVDGCFTVGSQNVAPDPLDDLVDRVRPRLARAVDSLQVAAALEADGVSDRAARVEYGFADVFALAEAVHRRLGPHPAVPLGAAAKPVGRPGMAVAAAPSARSAIREICHGALYALPCWIFPALLVVVGRRSLVLGLVLFGGLSWVLAGVVSWVGYRLLGAGQPRLAVRAVVWSTLGGLVAAGALGWLVTVRSGASPAMIGLAVGQLAFQMASTALMICRRELWLLVTMAPAVAAGAGYLALGRPLLPAAVTGGVTGVLASLAVAGWYLRSLADSPAAARAGGGSAGNQRSIRRALAGESASVAWVAAYGACSALFLLHAQAPYLLTRIDIALASVPLIVGTGVIEWRARRFSEQARVLPTQVAHPRQFVRRVRWQLVLGWLICCGTVAGLAVGVLFGLRWAGLLTPAAIVMCGAYVVLAGAYYLGFILADRGRFGWLCGSLGGATAVHLGAGFFLASAAEPVHDILWYLGSVVLLQVLLAVVLVPIVGQAWRYR